MNFFPVVEHWQIPEAAIIESAREMSRDGARGNEGIVFWLGNRYASTTRVEHLVGLRGPGVQKWADQVVIDSAVMNDVTDSCLEKELTLVGQIHSHGPWAGIDLSMVDHRLGIKVPYFLSVVAPGYAMTPKLELSNCGVHVYEPNFGYRRLRQSEISERILIVQDQRVQLSLVGEDNHD